MICRMINKYKPKKPKYPPPPCEMIKRDFHFNMFEYFSALIVRLYDEYNRL